jgi:hypothetical protein
MNRAGELVGGEPGDEAAVVVVHRVVPALGVGRQLGRIVVIGFSVDDFFAAFAGEHAEGDSLIWLTEEGIDEIVDEGPAAERTRGEAGALRIVALLGEPIFDVLAAVIAGLLVGGLLSVARSIVVGAIAHGRDARATLLFEAR